MDCKRDNMQRYSRSFLCHRVIIRSHSHPLLRTIMSGEFIMALQSDPEALAVFLKRIQGKRRHINKYTHEIAPRGSRLTNLSIISSAIAAFLSGGAFGGIKLTHTTGVALLGDSNFTYLCGAASFFSLVAAVATNLFRVHEIAPRLAKAQTCEAKLESIELQVTLKQLSLKEATARFEKCIAEVSFIQSNLKSPIWPRRVQLSRVSGTIAIANENRSGNTLAISGTATGVYSGIHLWLVVEVNNRIWPKEGEIIINEDETWNKTIFEEGTTKEFSLALYAMNAQADKAVRQWFDDCDRTGNYSELRRNSGMYRLNKIDHIMSKTRQ